jgi:hypothetical protein
MNQPNTQTNEVARLRSEITLRENLDAVAQDVWDELKAENARLRELLNRAIDIADKALDCLIPVFRGEHEELEAELKQLKEESTRLAPAPETVTQKGSPNKETPPGTTLRSEEYVLAGDKNLEGEFNTVKEPAPEWRELGPDEVIRKGDEEMHKDQTMWFMFPVNDRAIGTRAGLWSNFRFRTRRPLPKSKDLSDREATEKQPVKSGDLNEDLPLPKQELPMDYCGIMEYCKKWAKENLMEHEKEDFYARLGLLVDFATDFYSDEIEALKKNQK